MPKRPLVERLTRAGKLTLMQAGASDVAGGGYSPNPSRRARSATQMLALEPRMLFDGAAAASADHDLNDGADTSHSADSGKVNASSPAAPVAYVAPADSQTARELLVVDPSVRNWQSLIEGAKPGVEILLLDATRDGVAQIEAAVAQGGPVGAIYVLSHGEVGEVRLGTTRLTTINMDVFATNLANIGAHLTANADILLYGCDVAQGAGVSRFIADLARFTGADVAASTDATGSARLGGDWTLESQTGAIEAVNPLTAAAMSAYADVLAPTPTVVLASGAAGDLMPGDQNVFLGEAFSFKATFSNSVDTGYAPFINVYVPATGADGADGAGPPVVVNEDDGITLSGATLLGQSLTLVQTHVVTAAEVLAGTYAHPLYRDALGGAQVSIEGLRAGDTIYVYQLPFGSIAPTFPTLEVTVNGTLSPKADLGTPLTIKARSGFQFGADPLDNPASDPTVMQAGVSTLVVNPTLYTVRTEYVGPELETATGPNYVRQVRVVVDIANGQTITNLDLTSILPANAQFVSVDAGASTAGAASTSPSTSIPGGTLTWRVPSVTGGTGNSDAVLVYNFYVPEFDSSSA